MNSKVPTCPGDIIKEKIDRDDCSKTVQELCEKLYLNSDTLLGVILGKRRITKWIARRLEKHLNINAEYLLALQARRKRYFDNIKNKGKGGDAK